MPTQHPPSLRRKVRALTQACLAAWLAVTLLPVWLARTGQTIGPWPLDFWVAAQGSVLAYLLIVVVYAWLVNRWERQAGCLSFDVPERQET